MSPGALHTHDSRAPAPIGASWARAWAWSFLAWGALTIVLEVPILFMLYEHGAFRRWEYLLVPPTLHLVSALLTPAMLMVVWRCPMDRARLVRHIVPVAGSLLLLAAIDDFLSYWALEGLHQFFPHVKSLPVWPLSVLTRIYARNVVTYSEIAAVAYAVLYYRHYRERSLRAAQLETHLVQARLEVLRRQLHPHFLFNTLNTVTALMHRDVEAAERMIARLSDLLRAALNEHAEQEIPLRRELDLLERYVEIEKVRFGDRLTVVQVADHAALEANVPPFVLQVLVENALQHGVARSSGPGRVEILAAREGESLVLRVRDDGPGLAQGGGMGEGVGLANTRSRLEQLYGAASSLELVARPEGGVEASVRVPFRKASALPRTEIAGQPARTPLHSHPADEGTLPPAES